MKSRLNYVFWHFCNKAHRRYSSPRAPSCASQLFPLALECCESSVKRDKLTSVQLRPISFLTPPPLFSCFSARSLSPGRTREINPRGRVFWKLRWFFRQRWCVDDEGGGSLFQKKSCVDEAPSEWGYSSISHKWEILKISNSVWNSLNIGVPT